MLELLRFLKPRHEITVVSFIFNEDEMPWVEGLSAECKQVIPVMRTPQTQSDCLGPRLITDYRTREMEACLAALKLESHFDLADIEHIFMAQYAQFINAPAILQEHNIESQVLKRHSRLTKEDGGPTFFTQGEAFRDAHAESLKLERYESEIWPQFSLKVVVSDLDRQEMIRRCPIGRVEVIPNGVNTKDFRPSASLNSKGVLFTGTLDYQPNLDAAFLMCDSIWPLVQSRMPDACLYIIGRNPPPELLARRRPGVVEVIADVPSLVPYAKRCCISVVPLSVGGGTRIKILISLALGLPVISTPVGCEGLELKDGYELVIADEPVCFAQRMIQLMEDKELRRSLAHAGRTAVEDRYDWQHIFPRLERLYHEFVTTQQSAFL